jgi:hypothetical protein
MARASNKLSNTSSFVSDSRTLLRLALAAATSVFLHAAVVLFGHVTLPAPPEKLPPLAVRLERASPAPRPKASDEPPVAHKKKRRVISGPQVASITAPSPLVLPAPVEDPEPQEVATVEPEEPSSSDAQPTQTVEAPTPPVPPAPELPPVRSLPRNGRITYELVYGRDRFPVGRTVQTWQTDGTRYRLASRSETTGIIDFFRSQHRTYLSSGSMTRKGLRPDTFLMSRNRGRGPEQARAKFDWATSLVTLEGLAAAHTEQLPPNTQDLLSLMYQLSLDPPGPGRFRQSVTNGNHIETYELDALPEETIETPLGTLRAVPVRQVPKNGQESMEIWFASEYRNLPVRIRFFNRSGEPQGEQIVSEIRLSQE